LLIDNALKALKLLHTQDDVAIKIYNKYSQNIVMFPSSNKSPCSTQEKKTVKLNISSYRISLNSHIK